MRAQHWFGSAANSAMRWCGARQLCLAGLAGLLALGVLHPVVAAAFCGGDCNGDTSTSISEALGCNQIAAGNRDLSTCTACDCDGDLVVSSAEVSRAVSNAMQGCSDDCPPPPTNTPDPNSTSTPVPSPTVEATATRTATATHTPTIAESATPTHTSIVIDTPPATPPATCVGDCNGNGTVVIGELIRGVNIALDRAALQDCVSLDVNGNLQVGIGELIQAVRNALDGCP